MVVEKSARSKYQGPLPAQHCGNALVGLYFYARQPSSGALFKRYT